MVLGDSCERVVQLPPKGLVPTVESQCSRGMLYINTWCGHTLLLSAFVMKRENLVQWNTAAREEAWALIFTSPLANDETLNQSQASRAPNFGCWSTLNLALKVSSNMKYFL